MEQLLDFLKAPTNLGAHGGSTDGVGATDRSSRGGCPSAPWPSWVSHGAPWFGTGSDEAYGELREAWSLRGRNLGV